MPQQRSVDASCDTLEGEQYGGSQLNLDTGGTFSAQVAWDDPGGEYIVGLFLCDMYGNVISWSTVNNGDTVPLNLPNGSTNLVMVMSTKPGGTPPSSMKYRIGLQPVVPPPNPSPIVTNYPWMGGLDVAYLDPFW